MSKQIHRTDAELMDAADPLAPFRDRFDIQDPARIYFDGNSLGRPAEATIERISDALQTWSSELVEAWEDWIDLPERVGDLIGQELIGAAPGQVVMADGTTINLYKCASAALDRQRPRNVIVTDDLNFPTDRYLAEGVAKEFGGEVRFIRSDRTTGPGRETVAAALGSDVALVLLSQVDFRSAAIADVEGITQDAHAAGALVLWDLCHGVGAVPIELDRWGVDLAVGCTYKYLNSGPGAPAFLYVRHEHQATLAQPIWGWFGQRNRFEMGPDYDPEPGMVGWLSGGPAVIGLIAVESAVQILAEAGIQRLRAKGKALTKLAVDLFEEWLVPLGFELDSPTEPDRRGSHVSLRHPEAGLICRALRERADVVPDLRPPDSLRMAMAPIYTRFVDVWDGMDRLRQTVTDGVHHTLPDRVLRVT